MKIKGLKQVKFEIQYFGYYQLIGGICGIGLVGYQYYQIASEITPILTLILASTFMLFAFSILAGVLCLNDSPKKYFYSKINQALQVLSFSIGGIEFAHAAGIYCFLGVDITEEFVLAFSSGFGADFKFSIGSKSLFVAVNIVALYWINRLFQHENFIEEENERIRSAGEDINEHLIN